MKELLLAGIDTIQLTLKLLILKMESGMLCKQITMSGKMGDVSIDVLQLKRT